MNRALLLLLVGACVPQPVSKQAWERYATHRLDDAAFASDDSVELVNLGRELYFDERLSLNSNMSCDTCHDASTSGVDRRRMPTSAGTTGAMSATNAPTVFNMAPRTAWGWHADAKDLDELLLRPLNNFHGLKGYDVDVMVTGLGYADALTEHAGPWTSPEEAKERVAFALAAYTRTLASNDSPFDRFVGTSYANRDPTAMTPDAQRGAALFVGRAFCVECHSGPLFTDQKSVNIGVGDPLDRDDEGAAQTWRVAPLRDVTVGGPWFHDGETDDIVDVLWHYVDGGNAAFGADQHVAMQPLDLDGDDLQDLLAFLGALRGAPLPYCHVSSDEECCLQGQPTWDAGDDVCEKRVALHKRRP